MTDAMSGSKKVGGPLCGASFFLQGPQRVMRL